MELSDLLNTLPYAELFAVSCLVTLFYSQAQQKRFNKRALLRREAFDTRLQDVNSWRPLECIRPNHINN